MNRQTVAFITIDLSTCHKRRDRRVSRFCFHSSFSQRSGYKHIFKIIFPHIFVFLFVNIFPIKDIEMSGARQWLRSQSSLSWARPQVPASHWSSWPQYWPLIGPDVATQPLSTNRKPVWGQGGDQVQIFSFLDLMKIAKGNTFLNDSLIFDIDELLIFVIVRLYIEIILPADDLVSQEDSLHLRVLDMVASLVLHNL